MAAVHGRHDHFGDEDAPGVTVEGIGQVVLQPIKAEDGDAVMIDERPGHPRVRHEVRAPRLRARHEFSDPDLRSWESLGQGIVPDLVEWAG